MRHKTNLSSLHNAAIGAECLPVLESLVNSIDDLRQPDELRTSRARVLTQLVLRYGPALAAAAASDPAVRAALLGPSQRSPQRRKAPRGAPRARSEGV